MEYTHTVIYVDDVEETLNFYFQAFGLITAKLDESGQFGEVSTGNMNIAFASHPLAQSNFKQAYIRSHPKQPALGFELCFNCDDVTQAYEKAVQAGAEPLNAPVENYWGQKTAYVRSIEGTLVALCAKQ